MADCTRNRFLELDTEDYYMKRSFKRLLGLLLALSMVISGVSGVSMTAKAAGNYELYLVEQRGINQQHILPNGESMVFQAFLQEDGISCDDYYIKIESVSNEAFQTANAPANQATAVVGSGNTITVTSAPSGDEGQCKVTVGAYLPGGTTPVATRVLNVSILKELDRLEPLQGEFDDMNYEVHWDNINGPVPADGTATFMLDTTNVNNADYSVVFTLGETDSNGALSAFPNMANLYTTVTGANGKVTGITVDGSAVSQVCQNGNFRIAAEIFVKGYSVHRCDTMVTLAKPDYSVCLESGASVSATETSRVLALDVTKLLGKTYDINFTLGQGPVGSGFTPFGTQAGLFTKVKDNAGNVVGIDLNGEEIAKILQGNSFDIKTEVLINNEVVYTTGTSVNLVRGNANPGGVFFNGSTMVSFIDTAQMLPLNVSNLQLGKQRRLGINGPPPP